MPTPDSQTEGGDSGTNLLHAQDFGSDDAAPETTSSETEVSPESAEQVRFANMTKNPAVIEASGFFYLGGA